jgi:16S rRNA (guanine527-N7)-methyltransferase
MANKEFYKNYMAIFLEENSKINLISKNDEKYLWEKHVFDSLAFGNFYEKYLNGKKNINLLDIGTGGGFPAIPIALTYPDIEVTALDSIGKKIKAVENISEKLKLKNIHPLCMRAENLDREFDVVTSRAVSSLKNICEYALPRLKKNGYFVAYKSRKAPEEIEEATPVLKKYNAKILEVMEYDLPLEEKITRNLIIISK